MLDKKKLIQDLINISNELNKNGESRFRYIFLTEEFVLKQADELEISFDVMVDIIKNEMFNNDFA